MFRHAESRKYVKTGDIARRSLTYRTLSLLPASHRIVLHFVRQLLDIWKTYDGYVRVGVQRCLTVMIANNASSHIASSIKLLKFVPALLKAS